MPILVPPTNPRIEQRALTALDAIGASISQPLATDREGGGGLVAQLARPIPIFAPSSTPRASLKTARQTGWRYVVADSDRIGAIDIATDDAKGAQVIADPSVADRFGRALHAAANRLDDDDYELRLLDLNLIGDSVLWLHRPDKEDRFFALAGDHDEIAAAEIARRVQRGLDTLGASRSNRDAEAGG